MRAFELFCLRGGKHGFDLDDWLGAERELSLTEGEVILEQSDVATDLSISSARAEPGQMLLSLSEESVLIIWTSTQIDKGEIQNLSVGLVPLPRYVDPEGAAVEYADGRLHIHLPHREGKAIPTISPSANDSHKV